MFGFIKKLFPYNKPYKVKSKENFMDRIMAAKGEKRILRILIQPQIVEDYLFSLIVERNIMRRPHWVIVIVLYFILKFTAISRGDRKITYREVVFKRFSNKWEFLDSEEKDKVVVELFKIAQQRAEELKILSGGTVVVEIVGPDGRNNLKDSDINGSIFS